MVQSSLCHNRNNKLVLRMIKKFLKNFDMFTALPSLRVQGETQHASMGAGILSLIILMVFGAMLIQNSIELLQYKNIVSSESTRVNQALTQRQKREGQTVGGLKFAFGLKHFDIFQNPEGIQVTGRLVDKQLGSTTYEDIQMVPCTEEMWSDLDDDVKEDLQMRYNITTLACARNPQKLKLIGAKNSNHYQTIQFYLEACNNATYTGNGSCYSQTDVDALIQSVVEVEKYIEGIFIYLNTGFNPSDKNPLVKFIDDTIWLTFTHKAGTQAFVQIGTYYIQTDVSFSPFEEKEMLSGTYLANFMFAQFDRGITGIYAKVEVSMSPSHCFIERKYGKIDQIMAYFGGLFGIVMSLLGIIFMSFNEYRYQLIVGEGAFTLKDGKQSRESDFWFCTYVKYVFYDWIKILFCCKLPWENCQKIELTREEAIEQIDVKYLLKRISHLEKAVKSIVPHDQYFSLFVTEPQTIVEVQKSRKIMEYYQKIIGGRTSLTIKGIQKMKQKLAYLQELTAKSQYFPQSSSSFMNKDGHAKFSLEVINEYLKEYEEYLTEEAALINGKLDEDDLILEKQISDVFYNLQEDYRVGIAENIPLSILKRLKQAQETPVSFPPPEELWSANSALSETNVNKGNGLMNFMNLANASRMEMARTHKVKNSFRVQEM